MKNQFKFFAYPLSMIISLFVTVMLISSCSQTQQDGLTIQKIKESEIIAFQQSYAVSFNAISNAVGRKEEIELTAKNHIEKNYGFDYGKVLFKMGDAEQVPFRSTYEGMMSHLIGGNSSFPGDSGYALDKTYLLNWNNAGIINDQNIAIAIGQAELEDAKGNSLTQNYTMCFKKNQSGELKLIAHKIASPCN